MLSERVDNSRLVELARNGAGQEFRLPAADFARLSACTIRADKDRTVKGKGAVELAADIRFDIGPEGFPRVGLMITGHLSLQCQRCLEPVMWPVKIETRLTVLETDEQVTLLASPFDSVVMNADGLDLATVIEDEILAALPMVPVHQHEAACMQARVEDSNSEIVAEPMQKPFAVLASLMAERKSDADD